LAAFLSAFSDFLVASSISSFSLSELNLFCDRL
jgi:hypothetical protein